MIIILLLVIEYIISCKYQLVMCFYRTFFIVYFPFDLPYILQGLLQEDNVIDFSINCHLLLERFIPTFIRLLVNSVSIFLSKCQWIITFREDLSLRVRWTQLFKIPCQQIKISILILQHYSYKSNYHWTWMYFISHVIPCDLLMILVAWWSLYSSSRLSICTIDF